MTAGLFAVLAAKAPFGGLGRTLFNPAAAGVAFVTVCSPDKVFQYIAVPPGGYPLFEDVHGAALQSPSAMMAAGLKPSLPPLELLWGHVPGPMGTTAALVLIAGAVFLCSRRIINWETPVSMLLVSTLYAALFPRIACSPLTSVSYELLTGSLLYCSIFMATDPVTSPRTKGGRWITGPAPVFCSCSCVCLALMNRAPASPYCWPTRWFPSGPAGVLRRKAGWFALQTAKKLEELKDGKKTEIDAQRAGQGDLEFRNTGSRVPRQQWTLPWATDHYGDAVAQIDRDFPPDIITAPVKLEKYPPVQGNPYEVGTFVDEWGCMFNNMTKGIIGEVKQPLVTQED